MTGEGRQGRRPLSQVLFGRPRPWSACIWLALGLTWLGLAIVGPTVFHFILAAVWLTGGVGMLVVVLRDRAARRTVDR